MARHTSKQKLEQDLATYLQNKEQILSDVNQIAEAYKNGTISKKKHDELVSRYLLGQSLDYWMMVYNYSILATQQQLMKHERTERKQASWYARNENAVLALLVLFGAAYFLGGSITGFVVGGTALYNQSGFWLTESGFHYEGMAYVSNVEGSELYYRIAGTSIQLLTQRRDDYGLLHVFIDGQAELIDLYSPEPQYNVTIALAENLSDTEHDVIFRVTGGRNPNSRGSFVVIDSVVAETPVMTLVELPIQSLPVTAPLDLLTVTNSTGVWVEVNDMTYMNGAALLSNTNGSSLSYKFYGPAVTIVAQQRDDFGIMLMSLDGSVSAFDLWNDTSAHVNMTLWTVGSGQHTLVINVSGAKNPESFGTYMLVDEVMVSYGSEAQSVVLVAENMTIQHHAEINKPVRWTRRVHADALVVEVPSLENVTVKKKVDGAFEEISSRHLFIKKGTSTQPLDAYKDSLPVSNKLTGSAVGTKAENVTLIADEDADEYEVTYETPAPQISELNHSITKKEITVFSDYHYQNITTYTTLPKESPQTSIRLYHLVDNAKVLFTGDISYLDENENGLIDKIQWIVPHLSNQTYLIEITVLNVYSYPHAGDNWTVLFNTTGTANLTITPVNGTAWGREIDFVELKCGTDKLDIQFDGSAVFYPDYSCDKTGEEINLVHIPGYAALEFRFGDAIAYAYDPNAAGINASNVNITPYSLTVAMDAAGVWNYSHTNRTVENGSVWTWFINGTEVWREKSLIGYWKLDGNYTDFSGKGNDGRQDNTANQTSNITGVIKNAAYFSGDDFINISHSAKIDLGRAGDNYTISTWVKPTSADDKHRIIIIKRSLSGGPLPFTLYVVSSAYGNRFQAELYDGSSNNPFIRSQTVAQNNTWYHLTFVRTTDQLFLYVNGMLENSTVISDIDYRSTGDLLIGQQQNTQPWIGSIDEVRIYNRSLSATEIANLYNTMDYGQTEKAEMGTPAQDKPISLWHFNENTGTVAKDAFGKNDLSGTLGWTSNGQYGTPAVTFNGNTQSISNSGPRNLSLVGNITVEAWISPNGYGSFGSGRILSVGGFGSPDYELFLTANGSAVFRIHNTQTNVDVFSRVISNNTFTHLMATYNGSHMLIYRNGTQEGQTITSGPIRQSSSPSITVGNDAFGTNGYNGTLDSLAVYDRALTHEEINQSFLRTFPVFGLDTTVYGANSNLTFRIEPSDGVDFGIAQDSPLVTVSSIPDTTPPFWYNNVTNITRIASGDNVLFNVSWNDTTDLSTYIFSINDSIIETMSPFEEKFTNYSFRFSGTTNVSSFGKMINTTKRRGATIGWRMYANDTSNNWNQTSIFSFTLSNALPVAFSLNITPFSLTTSMDAAGVWNYTDNDNDPENGSVWTWFVNGTEVWRDPFLAGYWRFDGNYTDSSGYNNSLTQDTAANQPTNTSGLTKQAVSFSGSPQFLINPNMSINALSQVTLSVWFKTATSQTDAYLISFPNNSAAGNSGLDLYFPTATTLGSTIRTGGGGAGTTISGTVNYANNQWHHALTTYNGSNLLLYFDGVLIATGSRTGTISAAKELNIGRFGAFGLYFDGPTRIDDLRVYNRTLSATEITNLYNTMDYGQTEKAESGTPAQDKPISLWHFNENQGRTVKDA
ncbi:LamG domain-containing protein, partial [Candidatus Woesearchaeota archaeon]|nr:LamG domain-containing protein [Candidatus Woesearchaeota archaeon]